MKGKSLYTNLEEMVELNKLCKMPESKHPVTVYVTPFVHEGRKVVLLYVSSKADLVSVKIIHTKIIPALINNGYEPVIGEDKIENILEARTFARLTTKEWKEIAPWATK